MANDEVEATLTAPGQIFEIAVEPVRGVPTKVWKNVPPNLPTILELSRAHANKTFLVYEDERTSFDEHFRKAATFAHRLIERYDVAKGDRVAIAMRNFPEWVVSFWAATAAGAIVVPLNAWWTAPELVYGLADSGAKVLITDGERAARLKSELSGLGLAGVVVVRPDGPLPDGAEDYDAVLGEVASSDVTLPQVDIQPDDDATIFYTSGTTGKPKGALGTHRNICTGVMSLAYSVVAAATRSGGDVPDLATLGERPQECTLLNVPLFHVTGCHGVLLGSTAFGAKLVMMHKWDPDRALELIERERITTFGGVPSMVWQVLDSPDFAKRDISSVKAISYGGAPAPPELVRRIGEMFPGRTPSNGWGMTETSAGATSNAGADYVRKPDSVGAPLPVCEVKIVGADGQEVPAGALGELAVKGATVVRGYWNKPEATAETFVDGWLHTGDIARVDDEGFVYIVDRVKDMVIRGGENVYCAEVEGALFEHPTVTDCAVIGVPHDVLGEEVGAVVVARAGAAVTADELRAHVRERLAGFKVPAHVWFSEEPLPRNPAGKVLKRDLREAVLGAAEGQRDEPAG